MNESNAKPRWARAIFLLVLLTLIGSAVYAIIGYVSIKCGKGWVQRMLMKRAASGVAGG